MSEDFDFGKIAFIVIAMIAAFVQWVWKGIQERRELRKHQQETKPEHRTLREMTRDHELLLQDRPAPERRPAPSAPPTTLWGAFEQIKEELRKAQEQAAPLPPPLPARSGRRAAPPAVATKTLPSPAPLPPPTPPAEQPAGAVTKVGPAALSRDDFASLRRLVMDPKALRDAVLLREILGPPKALQSSSELMF